MSGPWSGYNTEPANFQFDVRKYADAYGKIDGVGCDGTTSGIDATIPKYSSPFVGGSSGYSFTNERIPIASPSAPYSIIEGYNDSNKNYRDNFPKHFPSLLTGGKRRRRHNKKNSKRHSKSKYTQYGCSKKRKCGGKKRTRRASRRSRKHKTRRGGILQLARRGGKRTMRGGVSSYADYTQGRNTTQDIPYGNEAYSFGQGLGSMMGSGESALASPPPFLPYNDCGKVMRN